MSTTSTVTILFRFLQLIPLVLILIPLVKSYLVRLYSINGLRRVRVSLITLISALIISNVYFIVFSYFKLSRSSTTGLVFLTFDKVITLVAYITLYFLFRHASTHDKK